MLGTIGHQGLLRSQHELTRTLQLDLAVTARSRNRTFDLPGTLLLDARLGWRPARLGEFSVAVQNLGGRKVLESYSEGLTPAIPLRQTFVIKWTQRF
jgi:outer membrane receptor protein involved in Fe transport